MRALGFGLCGLALLGGCGAGAGQAELRDLRTRLDAAEQARADLARKVEDLDNRVFLLTDQVESHKVALSRKGGEPRLPVVTLAPATEREVQAAPAYAADDGAGSYGTVQGSTEVTSASAAELPPRDPPRTIRDGNRPKLTLGGGDVPWLGADGGSSSSGERSSSSSGTPRKARRSPRPAADPRPVASSSPPSTSSPSDAPAAVSDSSGEDATALYREAYGKLKAGQPEQAAEGLRTFVQRFPQHDLADNAQYWLGESYYARASYREAIPEFRAVIRRWPSANKVPDALLKLGFCHLALGESTEGRATLAEVTSHYPRTEAAQLASKRLAELGSAPTENKP